MTFLIRESWVELEIIWIAGMEFGRALVRAEILSILKNVKVGTKGIDEECRRLCKCIETDPPSYRR